MTVITANQDEVIRFLLSLETEEGGGVQRLDTHASSVFLAGPRAFKLKRAVRYDYLDYSTADRRRAMCEAEVALNRRTAPSLYKGVVAVTREADAQLALAGSGTPVDWLVEMVRFEQESLFDRLAEQGKLSVELMGPLAEAVAAFHAAAEIRRDCGGERPLLDVIEGNDLAFADEGKDILDSSACHRLAHQLREEVARLRDLLEARRDAGYVRHCHGDLHLRNIVLLAGEPTLFDGLEFNESLSCIDVLYDLAFLLMDLAHRQLPEHANIVWNRYLAATSDLSGLPLLPLFQSCRAAILAKTSASAAGLASHSDVRQRHRDASRAYFDLSQRLIGRPPACVIAVGGWSGSGKSTLARALAPTFGAPPGALVIRSDEMRKRLSGVKPSTRLGDEGYSQDVTRRVYKALCSSVELIARGGATAIADAVFADPQQRASLEDCAAAAGVPFVGLWLHAPASQLMTRVTARAGDASDADAAVVRAQLSSDPGPIGWRRVDASGTPGDVVRRATDVLSSALGARFPGPVAAVRARE